MLGKYKGFPRLGKIVFHWACAKIGCARCNHFRVETFLGNKNILHLFPRLLAWTFYRCFNGTTVCGIEMRNVETCQNYQMVQNIEKRSMPH